MCFVSSNSKHMYIAIWCIDVQAGQAGSEVMNHTIGLNKAAEPPKLTHVAPGAWSNSGLESLPEIKVNGEEKPHQRPHSSTIDAEKDGENCSYNITCWCSSICSFASVQGAFWWEKWSNIIHHNHFTGMLSIVMASFSCSHSPSSIHFNFHLFLYFNVFANSFPDRFFCTPATFRRGLVFSTAFFSFALKPVAPFISLIYLQLFIFADMQAII